MPQPPPQLSFQLRIELAGVTPAIWRRLVVPGGVRLDRLADMLLVAMGWSNSHLHCFEIADKRYGMHLDERPFGEIDEKTVTVRTALREVDAFVFEYDFGDGWIHEVVVEAAVETAHVLAHAVCLDGENACPPEDCGGPDGFERLVSALAAPNHDVDQDAVRWIGTDPFDPSAFDLVGTNAALQRLRARSRTARR